MFRSRNLLILLVSLPFALSAQTTTPPAGRPPINTNAPSSNTYPQIVRIRYMEGDVRVARGKEIAKSTHNTWEQAVIDLPLADGYNLVTGAGRAEIEFEDASTMFLGENSALALDDVRTTGGIPYTALTLLSGTLTVHVKASLPTDTYLITTPTDSLSVSYPEKLYARINSYLDATAITTQKYESYDLTGTNMQGASGVAVFYNEGKVVTPPAPVDAHAFADWDAWVGTRVTLRSAALASVAAASGLPASTPGLADLYGKGTFFNCAPYGTCWVPPSDDDPSISGPQDVPSSGPAAPDFSLFLSPVSVTANPGDKPKTKVSMVAIAGFADPVGITVSLPAGISCAGSCLGQVTPAQPLGLQFAVASPLADGAYPMSITASAGARSHTVVFTIYLAQAQVSGFAMPETPAVIPYFPCFPDGIRPLTIRDHLGRTVSLTYRYGASTYPYAWGVCHTGTWIYRSNVYVWVVPKGTERKRHHHVPAWWTKCGKEVCYVPRHPRDVAGKPPLNRIHEVFKLGDKEGRTVNSANLTPKDKVGLLKEAPKEIRKNEPIPLARAEDPNVRTHEMKDAGTVAAGGGAGVGATYLVFDAKRDNFLYASEEAGGGKTRMSTRTFEDHR